MCIHNHQERDVKSYVRCGFTRPFEAPATQSHFKLELGEKVRFRAGYVVWDSDGQVTNSRDAYAASNMLEAKLLEISGAASAVFSLIGLGTLMQALVV